MVPRLEVETMSCNAGNGKLHPVTDHDDPEGEWRYSSILSLTSATLSEPRSGCFTPGKKTCYPQYKRQRGLQGRARHLRKISFPLGFDLRTVQPGASLYADYAIPTLNNNNNNNNNNNMKADKTPAPVGN
jgi:hypothetical protein